MYCNLSKDLGIERKVSFVRLMLKKMHMLIRISLSKVGNHIIPT